MTVAARDCTHGGRHTHGTRLAYTEDGCRCDPCRAASSAYLLARQKANRCGRPLRVDAAPVARHIRALLDAGMSLVGIEKSAGLGQGTVRKILTRGSTVRAAVASAILTVTYTPGGAAVPAAGTIRRIRALARAGWPITTTLTVAGISDEPYYHGLERGVVTAATAGRVATAYDTLTQRTPPQGRTTTRTVNMATRRGWPPPAAYDDTTIDDPDPAVDEAAKSATPTLRQLRAAARRTRPGKGAIDMADLEHLTRYGHDVTSVADRLGVTVGAIRTACHRNGRADILARLDAQAPTAEKCPTCGVVFGNHQTLAAHEGRHHGRTA